LNTLSFLPRLAAAFDQCSFGPRLSANWHTAVFLVSNTATLNCDTEWILEGGLERNGDTSIRQPMRIKPLHLIVGIATAGRSDVLSQTLRVLAEQTRLPDRLIICPASPNDVERVAIDTFPSPVLVVSGARGLPAQRNRILSECPGADAIVFFDDDFFPSRDYLAEVERLLQERPDVVGLTGFLLDDGINGPGIPFNDGLRILAESKKAPFERSFELHGAYGCNMSFRLAPVRQHGLLFDENLPLYGWQEDVDFSRQLAPYGKIVKSNKMQGVHLGTKRGRTSGVRLGYSQVANPIYLARKGTFANTLAAHRILRNILANIFRSLIPEPWVDRRGRLKGNLIAIGDLVSGRLSPQRILELD
jgi:GT2 family glycosyltransferase